MRLAEKLAPELVDRLTEDCVIPVFRDWRAGRIDRLDEIDVALEERVKSWLVSEPAKFALRPLIDDWFAGLQRDIEQDTDPLCRDHGLPAMVLSLDDSQHVSRYLEGMSVAAPKVASLETDTALGRDDPDHADCRSPAGKGEFTGTASRQSAGPCYWRRFGRGRIYRGEKGAQR